MDRFMRGLWAFLSTAESVAFVLAVCGLVLAFSLGKAGLKKINKKNEDKLWRWTSYAMFTKLGIMPITLLWTLINWFRY